jgi:hypothetical protein
MWRKVVPLGPPARVPSFNKGKKETHRVNSEELEQAIGPTYPLARQVSEALAGAVYPLTRGHLVWVARENDAPATLLTLLSNLVDRSYRSLDEVEEQLDQAQTADKPA